MAREGALARPSRSGHAQPLSYISAINAFIVNIPSLLPSSMPPVHREIRALQTLVDWASSLLDRMTRHGDQPDPCFVDALAAVAGHAERLCDTLGKLRKNGGRRNSSTLNEVVPNGTKNRIQRRFLKSGKQQVMNAFQHGVAELSATLLATFLSISRNKTILHTVIPTPLSTLNTAKDLDAAARELRMSDTVVASIIEGMDSLSHHYFSSLAARIRHAVDAVANPVLRIGLAVALQGAARKLQADRGVSAAVLRALLASGRASPVDDREFSENKKSIFLPIWLLPPWMQSGGWDGAEDMAPREVDPRPTSTLLTLEESPRFAENKPSATASLWPFQAGKTSILFSKSTTIFGTVTLCTNVTPLRPCAGGLLRIVEVITSYSFQPSQWLLRCGVRHGIHAEVVHAQQALTALISLPLVLRPTNNLFFRFSMVGSIAGLQIMLSQREATVHDQDLHGWTALHQACFFSQYETARFLIEQGADKTAKHNKLVFPDEIKACTPLAVLGLDPSMEEDVIWNWILLFGNTMDFSDQGDGWPFLLKLLRPPRTNVGRMLRWIASRFPDMLIPADSDLGLYIQGKCRFELWNESGMAGQEDPDMMYGMPATPISVLAVLDSMVYMPWGVDLVANWLIFMMCRGFDLNLTFEKESITTMALWNARLAVFWVSVVWAVDDRLRGNNASAAIAVESAGAGAFVDRFLARELSNPSLPWHGKPSVATTLYWMFAKPEHRNILPSGVAPHLTGISVFTGRFDSQWTLLCTLCHDPQVAEDVLQPHWELFLVNTLWHGADPEKYLASLIGKRKPWHKRRRSQSLDGKLGYDEDSSQDGDSYYDSDGSSQDDGSSSDGKNENEDEDEDANEEKNENKVESKDDGESSPNDEQFRDRVAKVSAPGELPDHGDDVFTRQQSHSPQDTQFSSSPPPPASVLSSQQQLPELSKFADVQDFDSSDPLDPQALNSEGLPVPTSDHGHAKNTQDIVETPSSPREAHYDDASSSCRSPCSSSSGRDTPSESVNVDQWELPRRLSRANLMADFLRHSKWFEDRVRHDDMFCAECMRSLEVIILGRSRLRPSNPFMLPDPSWMSPEKLTRIITRGFNPPQPEMRTAPMHQRYYWI